MTVYFESNLVLEIALGQQGSADAEAIIDVAERQGIPLAVPSFAMFEPFSRVTNSGRRRKTLKNQIIEKELPELRRSTPHGRNVRDLESIAGIFDEIEQREKQLLAATVRRLFQVAEIIAVDSAVYEEALRFLEEYGFREMQDAIICAAVLGHLRGNESSQRHYFVTTNAKDFEFPGVIETLESHGCVLVRSFRECAQRLQQQQ
jgi:hypothetical protein